ncbi:MAG: hypothetical protein HQK66_14360 [Desulfamplus sp.]|nr:hypothetical protein [Desulfamplus sp.]
MQSLNAVKVVIKLGDVWQSPALHVLLTKEENVVVARCLDFRISSHGKDENEAVHALADSIKEYLLTAIEENGYDDIFDPANNKYWRLFHEIELKKSFSELNRSMSIVLDKKLFDVVKNVAPVVLYA